MSHLEVYLQGSASDALAGGAAEAETASADITEKELLREINGRLSVLKQDLEAACARACSARFNPNSVSELLLFADYFGSSQLSEACTKFMSLCQKRSDLISQQSPPVLLSHWKGFNNMNVHCSSSSDMSTDEPEIDLVGPSKKISGGGSSSQVCRPTDSEHSTECLSEHVREQQTKPTAQHVVGKQEKETDAPLPVPAGGGGSKKLSVQDRINMFEKQSSFGNVQDRINMFERQSSFGNSNAVVSWNAVHRRVPARVSLETPELASIDVTKNDSSGFHDRKEARSSVGTPRSANLEDNSKAKADEEDGELMDKATSCLWSGQKDDTNYISMDSTTTSTCSFLTSSTTSSTLSSISTASLKQTIDCKEDNMLTTLGIETVSSFEKDQGVNQGDCNAGKSEHTTTNAFNRTQLKASPKLVDEASAKDIASLPRLSSKKHVQMINQETSAVAYDIPVVSEQIAQKGTKCHHLQTRKIHGAAGIRIEDKSNRMYGKISGSVNPKSTGGVDTKSRAPSASRIKYRASSGRNGASSSETEAHAFSLQQKNLPRKGEISINSETSSLDGCVCRQTNLSRQSSVSEQELNVQGGKLGCINDGDGSLFFGMNVKEFLHMHDPPKPTLLEQARVKRLTKGKHDRNDELQMKADELKALFAAQLISSRRGKSIDVQVDNLPKTNEVNPALVLLDQVFTEQAVESTTSNFDANKLQKIVDKHECESIIQQKHGLFSLEESRGKFYKQYMQKRDAKLRKDWKLQREQQEAILKVMHDSLEHSKAEMHTKLLHSANVQDSTYASHGAKKILSFQSAIKNKNQGVEDEVNSDYLSVDGLSRKHFPHKVSSTKRISTAHAFKPSSRTVKSGYTNCRSPQGNPFAQSVHNISDFRKEITKPSAGIDRSTARAQPMSFSHSRSITVESKSILKEDKSRKLQSVRKSSSPGQLKGISSLTEDILNWAPTRISKDQAEGDFFNHENVTLKSFLKEGNGARTIFGVTGLQASMVRNAFLNGEDDELVDQQEDSSDNAKENEEYESIEENLRESDIPADSESETPRKSHEFGNSDEPGSEDGDLFHPGEAAALTSMKFDAFAGKTHHLSGRLPPPWNLHIPHSYACSNDNSDTEAFADSPTGSSSPWNTHPLEQIIDADVFQMRKKWGSAEIPVVDANATQQPCNDAMKGFKKPLKFGRKNRGFDGLANVWVPASTVSECDDDMEDVHDLNVGFSNDFSRSRMDPLSSYDGFVENIIFTEQAPRPFFSRSMFQGKGSDARIR